MDKEQNIDELFAKTVRKLRILYGLTQEECAKLIKMSPQSYRHLETGQKRISMLAVERLSDVFGLQPWELMKIVEKVPENDMEFWSSYQLGELGAADNS